MDSISIFELNFTKCILCQSRFKELVNKEITLVCYFPVLRLAVQDAVRVVSHNFCTISDKSIFPGATTYNFFED